MHPEEIAALLRRAVRERALRPGQVVNQDELARRLGVSRIPLREALRTLVGEGLVVMKPGRGAIVTELDVREVGELYDLRLQLEPPLAQAIVDQARARDIVRLAELVVRMGEVEETDPEEWSGFNHGFRCLLYELSERRHSIRLVKQLLNLVEPYSRSHTQALGARERVRRQLADELDALRDRDADRLGALITRGLVRAREALTAQMSEHEKPVRDISKLFRTD